MSMKRECSNCNSKHPLAKMIVIQSKSKTVALICPACQQAKKIQLTFEKTKEGDWKFFQYFPLET